MALRAVVPLVTLQTGVTAGPALVGLEVGEVAGTAGLHTVSVLTGGNYVETENKLRKF